MFQDYENTFRGTEDEFVNHFIQLMAPKEMRLGEHFVFGDYFKEVSIPEIGRRSDLVVRVKGKTERFFNLEFKLERQDELLKQGKDHCKWADYSYIVLPKHFLRICPQHFLPILFQTYVGLIIGDKSSFTIIRRAPYITYSEGKVKRIREAVKAKLRQKAAIPVERERSWLEF